MDVTINEIAKKAGVSKTTVSFILNDKGDRYKISPQTIYKVKKIIKETNYAPNLYAKGFREKQTRSLGLVIPDPVNPFFADLSKEIERQARKYGYQILISCSEDKKDTELAVTIDLVKRRVDGLVIASVLQNKTVIARHYNALKRSIVFIDRTINLPQSSWVVSDNYSGAFQLTSKLCKTVSGKIAFIGGDKKLSTSKARKKGFYDALRQYNFTPDKKIIKETTYTANSGYKAMQKIYNIYKTMPAAVFTGAYSLLEGVLRFITETNKKTIVATFDDHPLLDHLSVPVISAKQDTVKIAAAALKVLLSQFKKQNIKQKITIPPIINERRISYA
ncbi:MAG TPA: LacI family DNA-binding transcriptional regulator [Spirochaetota bacterium]|nr:LacI family DNA-binding transcriptional regulator [Spirochaetota bacterium]